jgi:hypothetical protein
MARTETYAVTTTPGLVIALGVCNEIEIGEDPSIGASWPTGDYKIYGNVTDTPRQRKAGTTYTFKRNRPYQPGDVAGAVATVTGSTTFFQSELP